MCFFGWLLKMYVDFENKLCDEVDWVLKVENDLLVKINVWYFIDVFFYGFD